MKLIIAKVKSKLYKVSGNLAAIFQQMISYKKYLNSFIANGPQGEFYEDGAQRGDFF